MVADEQFSDKDFDPLFSEKEKKNQISRKFLPFLLLRFC